MPQITTDRIDKLKYFQMTIYQCQKNEINDVIMLIKVVKSMGSDSKKLKL